MTDNSFNPLPFYTDPSLRNACKLECAGNDCNDFFISVGQVLGPFIFCTDSLNPVIPFVHEITLFGIDDVQIGDPIPIRINKYDCEGNTYVYSNMDFVDVAFDLSAANWSGTADLTTIGQATFDNGEDIVSDDQLTQDKLYRLFFNVDAAVGDFEVYLTDDNVTLPVTQSIFAGNLTGQLLFEFTPALVNLFLVIRYKVAAVPQMVINDFSLTCAWITDDIPCSTIGYITIETDEGGETTFFSELFKSKDQEVLDCDHNKFTFENDCDLECFKLSLLDPMFIYLQACLNDGGQTGESAVWKPEYEVTVRGGFNENSVFIDEFRKVDKTFPVRFRMIPEYLVDLINNFPFFDIFSITRDDLSITAVDHDISGNPDWQESGCFADVQLDVVSNSTIETGCCDCITILPGQTVFELFPGAESGHSLNRLLDSGYVGDAFIIRRASDDEELNIGILNGIAQIEAAEAFCNETEPTDGFLVTVFDQSGNGFDLVTSSNASQPKIVSAGSLITDSNGLLVAQFDGVDDKLSATYSGALANPVSLFSTWLTTGVDSGLSTIYFGLFTGSSHGGSLIDRGANIAAIYQNGPAFGPNAAIAVSSPFITTFLTSIIGTDWIHRQNGTALTNSGEDIGTQTGNTLFIGARGNSTAFSVMEWQEILVYASDESLNFSGIELNINAFYQVF